jgi:hypothetical protein
LTRTPWTWAARCRFSSGCCREVPRPIKGYRPLPARDTFHWKVFRAEASLVVIICPPGAGPLALGDHRRVRARRDHHLGVGPSAAGHQGGPRRRHGHDRPAPRGGDRRRHPRAARRDPPVALARRTPGRRERAAAGHRRDDRHGARAHPGLGSARRGRLRDHRGRGRRHRRADQRGRRRRRAGRRAHPHAEHARRLVDRRRGRVRDRRGLRGPRRQPRGATDWRGHRHRGGRARSGGGNPGRKARAGRVGTD